MTKIKAECPWVIFGGNAAGRPHIGEELASGLSEDEALELIRKALHFYILAARGKERTWNF